MRYTFADWAKAHKELFSQPKKESVKKVSTPIKKEEPTKPVFNQEENKKEKKSKVEKTSLSSKTKEENIEIKSDVDLKDDH